MWPQAAHYTLAGLRLETHGLSQGQLLKQSTSPQINFYHAPQTPSHKQS